MDMKDNIDKKLELFEKRFDQLWKDAERASANKNLFLLAEIVEGLKRTDAKIVTLKALSRGEN